MAERVLKGKTLTELGKTWMDERTWVVAEPFLGAFPLGSA